MCASHASRNANRCASSVIDTSPTWMVFRLSSPGSAPAGRRTHLDRGRPVRFDPRVLLGVALAGAWASALLALGDEIDRGRGSKTERLRGTALRSQTPEECR